MLTTKARKTMRVLVVDDEEHLRHVMRLTLEASGYEVGEAANGEEALRLFGDGFSFDAILLDQRMPGLDGLETLKRMKARRADVCVIMVTAYATVELAVDAMKLGATDFVRKPMTPETLRHAVAAALAKHGRRVASAAPAGATTSLESPAEIWTTNGFFIRRAERSGVSGERPSNDHYFVVRRGTEAAGAEVVVSIDPQAVARIARECGKDLPGAGGFWHHQAENALINHLWSEAALPPAGRLVIDRISGPMVDEAMAWSGD
jgi:DNA-binding response OmpR family regulator